MDELGLDKRIKWYHTVLFYLSWALSVVFGIVIFFMARTVLRMLFFNFVLNEWIGQAVATLFDKVFVVVVGVAILGFIVFVQDYFYKGLIKNVFFKRVLRVLGIELLIVFISNVLIAIPKFSSPEKASLLLLIGAELLTGTVLIIFSFLANEVKICRR